MKKKILLIDDEEDLVEELKLGLKGNGYEILTAFDGQEGLEKARREKPGLILLDIKMPCGTGRSVLQALRSKEDTKKIPVIVITGLEEPGLEQRLLAEGADGFLKKPFEVDPLLGKIRSLLLSRE